MADILTLSSEGEPVPGLSYRQDGEKQHLPCAGPQTMAWAALHSRLLSKRRQQRGANCDAVKLPIRRPTTSLLRVLPYLTLLDDTNPHRVTKGGSSYPSASTLPGATTGGVIRPAVTQRSLASSSGRKWADLHPKRANLSVAASKVSAFQP